MNNKQLKNLKDRLWQGADQLRANSGLKSTEYATPILGLIFLRFAQSKYGKFETTINAEYKKTKGSRAQRAIHEIAIVRYSTPLAVQAVCSSRRRIILRVTPQKATRLTCAHTVLKKLPQR